MNDWRLLQQYVEDGSQAAFAKLIERHYKLVYATCFREIRDRQLAEDAAQAVFLVLSKKARGMRAEISLSGWLFNTSRFVSMSAVTRESRRRARELKAAENLLALPPEHEPIWREIDPVLNDAIASLRQADREAILLRFYHDLSLAETGQSLGISEDAARMRVARAVEKVRIYLAKSGVSVPQTTLVILLGLYAVDAEAGIGAAAGIAETIASMVAGTAAVGSGGALIGSYAAAAIRAMDLVKRKMIAAVAAACLLGAAAAVLVLGRHGDGPPAPRATAPAAAKTVYLSDELWRSNKGDPAAAKLLDDMVAAYQGLASYSATLEASGGFESRPKGVMIFIEDVALVHPNKISIRQGSLPGVAPGRLRHIIPETRSDGVKLQILGPNKRTVTAPNGSASAVVHRAFVMAGTDRSMLPILLTVPRPLADMFGGDHVNKDNLKSFALGKPGVQDGVATDQVIVDTFPIWNGAKIEMTYDFKIGRADHLLRQITTVRQSSNGRGLGGHKRITYNENYFHVTANPRLTDSLFAIK